MAGINDFYRAYFLFTTAGKWTLLKYSESVVVLTIHRELYDIQLTDYMKEQNSVITITKGCRYNYSGQLSLLDSQILETCNFIRNDKLGF